MTDDTNIQSTHAANAGNALGFAAAVVFLFPALILVLRPAADLGLGLLALAGFWIAFQRRGNGQASREEKLLYFAVTFFFFTALFVTLLAGIDDAGITILGKFARLVLVIPAYGLLRRVGVNLAALWYGLVTGAIVAAGMAIYQVWGDVHFGSAEGITSPTVFGDVALVIACMALAGAGWFKARAQWQLVLPAFAIVAGLLASTLSQSPGGRVAIPFLLMILIWYAWTRMARRRLGVSAVIFCALLGASQFIPVTDVATPGDRTHDRVGQFVQTDSDGGRARDFAGIDIEMLRASWQIYLAHPFTGVGWGHFRTEAQALVDRGLQQPFAVLSNHPHNQFFATLTNGGTLACLAYLLLFLLPAKLLLNVVRRGKSVDAQRLALAGLLLIVAYLVFGFFDVVLERARPVSFLAFYLAVIFAAIHTQSRVSRSEPAERKKSLSVIIIAQDEADRIEPCLQSVANWADEIIVLDSGSSDDTVEIARRYTNRVFETDWPGYGPQKQRALEKASCDWVLSIDADERVSAELRHDIDAVLTDNPECVGYRTPWAVIVYGHRMDFGRSARAPRRLFKREGAHFTDAQVHEHVVLTAGKKGTLEGRLYHYTHRNYGHALQKSAKYAWLGGQKRFAAGKWGGGLPAAALRSLWNFILIYFLRLGFLDGQVGFVVAVTYAQGAFNKYGALWALRREQRLAKK